MILCTKIYVHEQDLQSFHQELGAYRELYADFKVAMSLSVNWQGRWSDFKGPYSMAGQTRKCEGK